MEATEPLHYTWHPDYAIIIEPHTTLSLNIDETLPYRPDLARYVVFVPITGSFNDLPHLITDMTASIQRHGALHTTEIDEDLVGGVWFQYRAEHDIGDLNLFTINRLNDFYIAATYGPHALDGTARPYDMWDGQAIPMLC